MSDVEARRLFFKRVFGGTVAKGAALMAADWPR
jgi:hypothetical protein